MILSRLEVLRGINFNDMKILVTAFGSFGNFKINPSEIVLLEVKHKWQPIVGVKIDFKVLDVSFQSVREFYSLIDQEYDLILNLGVASDEQKTRFELKAKNKMDGEDINGVNGGDAEIIEGRKDRETTFPIEILHSVHNEFIDKIIFSSDAGSYLCNYIYFMGLELYLKATVLFIHIADFQNIKGSVDPQSQSEIVTRIIAGFIDYRKDSIILLA